MEELSSVGRGSKVYVAVEADFRADGKILPTSVTWENGRKYAIDRVEDIRRAASLKAGGVGIRYTVRIGQRTTWLFLEENRWFVERKSG